MECRRRFACRRGRRCIFATASPLSSRFLAHSAAARSLSVCPSPVSRISPPLSTSLPQGCRTTEVCGCKAEPMPWAWGAAEKGACMHLKYGGMSAVHMHHTLHKVLSFGLPHPFACLMRLASTCENCSLSAFWCPMLRGRRDCSGLPRVSTCPEGGPADRRPCCCRRAAGPPPSRAPSHTLLRSPGRAGLAARASRVGRSPFKAEDGDCAACFFATPRGRQLRDPAL